MHFSPDWLWSFSIFWWKLETRFLICEERRINLRKKSHEKMCLKITCALFLRSRRLRKCGWIIIQFGLFTNSLLTCYSSSTSHREDFLQLCSEKLADDEWNSFAWVETRWFKYDTVEIGYKSFCNGVECQQKKYLSNVTNRGLILGTITKTWWRQKHQRTPAVTNPTH